MNSLVVVTAKVRAKILVGFWWRKSLQSKAGILAGTRIDTCFVGHFHVCVWEQFAVSNGDRVKPTPKGVGERVLGSKFEWPDKLSTGR